MSSKESRAWEIRLWTNDGFFQLTNDEQAWIIAQIVQHEPGRRMGIVLTLIREMGWE